MKIGDALAHRPPLQIVFRPAFFRPVDTKVLHIVQSGFSTPQDAAVWAVGLVVEFGGVSVQLVLDPLTVPVMLQIALYGSVKAGRDTAILIHLPSEIVHHV